MKFFFFCVFLCAAHSFSAQTVNQIKILKVADSLVTGGFSGVIGITTPKEDSKVFSGGLANHEINKPIEENQFFNLLSLGKSLTAAIIVKLVQEKKLALEDTIEKYLPNRKIPNQDKITIRQLLSHSSGLGDYMNSEDYKNLPRATVEIETLLPIIESQPVEALPGESFVYSNSGYIVLGAVIEAVEKKPYEKVVREKILEPADIQQVYFSIDDREVKYYRQQFEEPVNKELHTASSDGGMWMRANDVLKFLNFLYSNEITEESRDLLFSPMIEFPDRGERKNAGLAASFLIYEYPQGVRVIGNNGGYKGSTYSTFKIMYNSKGDRIMATVLSNQENAAGPAMKALETEIRKILQ